MTFDELQSTDVVISFMVLTATMGNPVPVACTLGSRKPGNF